MRLLLPYSRKRERRGRVNAFVTIIVRVKTQQSDTLSFPWDGHIIITMPTNGVWLLVLVLALPWIKAATRADLNALADVVQHIC